MTTIPALAPLAWLLCPLHYCSAVEENAPLVSSSSKSLQASTLLLGPSCRSLPPLHRSSCRSIHHGPSAGSEASTGSARSEPRCGSLLVHTWRRTAARFCGGVSCVSRTEVLAVSDPSVTPCRAEDERPNRDEPTPDLHPIYFSRYGT